MKIVQENSLCTKCLNGGHYAKIYPKTNFKCHKEGSNEEQNTLLHPPPSKPDGGGTSESQLNREGLRLNTIRSWRRDVGDWSQGEVKFVPTTGVQGRRRR